MEEEFAYVEKLAALIVPFLDFVWNVAASTSLLHCPCCAGVFQSQLLKQYAAYIRDEKRTTEIKSTKECSCH
jgi:hypothetical protein